ncbi:L-rhamnose mutarotase [Terrimonas pollutisoli]|uniref:L-rhamnose mutarotase n=1 Tax=Terrimonas pollutisoli TaxID=3034147 RepID=UPI0023ECDA0A|nr:L-rhamnose mutarotase [Terrimonas sp. H1YJ31]
MKNFRAASLLFLFTVLIIFLSCKNQQQTSTQEKIVEKVFVVKIVPNADSLQQYLTYHKQVWPQVEQGFKKAGYRKIVLYQFHRLIVMTIQVPEGADMEEMGKVAESYDPRCAEWNRLMNNYQVGVEGTQPGVKWVEAQPIYSFSNQ